MRTGKMIASAFPPTIYFLRVRIQLQEQDEMGPVHILLYRGSYGSTDCDALCQVPEKTKIFAHRAPPLLTS